MSPLAAAILGAIVGALITAVAMSRLIGRQREPAEPVRPAVPAELLVAIAQLSSAAVVVGRHDEVIAASESAASLGVVRGSRLVMQPVLEAVRASRRDEQPTTVQVNVTSGLGTPARQLGVRVAPLGNELILVVADDRSAAQRVVETRRDFVANVTHELKTPIGAISLLAEALESTPDDEVAVRRFVGKLGTEVSRLNELVSQIIALSRLQAHDPLLAAERFEVSETVADAIDRCRSMSESRRVSITTNETDGLEIRGDRSHIEAAVANLIQNAIAYSHEGARVAITTRATVRDGDRWVEISVSDNGIGIAEEDQSRLFERFFRVDYGRSRSHGGTGLGLSIVKHVVETHGGSVSVWSSPGQGSTFTLRLPAYEPAERSPA